MTTVYPTRLGEAGAPGHDRQHARALFDELTHEPAGSPRRQRLRAELVEIHLPLARAMAFRYAGRSEPVDDLVQVAAIGLIKAVDRFDPGRDLQFSTYAAPTILGEIRRHFRDRTWRIRVTRRLQELSADVNRARGDLNQVLGRSPPVAEIAANLHRSEEEVLEGLDVAAAYTTDSLDDPVGENLRRGDLLGQADTGLEGVDLHESLTPLLRRLPERERRIVQLRFYGNRTQSQIATELGISQMHVSRLLARTLAGLRSQLLREP